MSETYTIGSSALTSLQAILTDNGSSLTGDGLTAIKALLETFEAALHQKLPHQYYLSSIDPGMGKTLSVRCFLQAWKSEGFLPSTGALVVFARKEQIREFIEASDLEPANDIAVLTSDDEINSLGVPKEARTDAPVLFTTHEMIRRRTRNGSFKDLSQFHHKGHPRALRIWDETLLPAEGVALRLDDIGALASKYRASHPGFIEVVELFRTVLANTEIGSTVVVPETFAEMRPRNSNRVISKLSSLSGREAVLVENDREGKALIGVRPPLPEDFSPVIILDASGRVRPTYALWEKHRGNLSRLPSAQNDYEDLNISLWTKGSGKSALENAAARSVVVNAVAGIINRDDTSRWLLIHYKERSDLAEELKLAVAHSPEDRIKTLTWGRHDATNAFKDIENVIVIGQLTYGELSYQALACGAAGLPLSQAQQFDTRDFQWGEFQHNLLQALARASVRKSSDGMAGECRAIIIATPLPETARRVRDTFPNCELQQWMPDEKPMAGHVKNAAEYLTERFSDPAVKQITKKELCEHLGMNKSNFSNHILNHAQFVEFLADENIKITHRELVKHQAGFDPWPEGFIAEEQPV